MLMMVFGMSVFAQEESVTNTIILSLDGRARMIVTDPSGAKIGSQGFDVHEEVDTADQYLGNDEQQIVFSQALAGTYSIDIKNQRSEQSLLTITTYGPGQPYKEQNLTLWSDKNTSATYAFDYDFSAIENSFRFTGLAAPRVSVELTDGMTVLNWLPVQTASNYRVFYKRYDYPYYQYMGETSDQRFATNVQWASESNDMFVPNNLHYFVVLSEKADGSQSFLSSLVSNDDQDNDGYNDWREQALGTDSQSSDSDGDGIDDFSEVNRYYTNPLDSDSDNDGFTDNVEIASGTIPFNADSFPGKLDECIGEGDWSVVSDCEVSQDTKVQGNIIVHPNALMTLRKRVTLWFDYTKNKILVLFGGGIKLEEGASIRQSD